MLLRTLLAALVAGAFALFVAGCLSVDRARATDSSEPEADTTAPEDTSTDTGSYDADATAPPDAPGPSPDATEPDAEPEGVFELGVNTTGASTPDAWSPLEEGGELTLEYGPQGLWMVVLAFRTRDVFEGEVTVHARLMVATMDMGELTLAGQNLVPGGGGWWYYYNFFLVVADPAVAGGQEADVHFDVEDEAGHRVEIVRHVLLVGGPEA